MKKGDKILAIILVLTVIVTGVYLWSRRRPSGDVIAVITVDGREFRRINLSQVTEPYTIPIQPDPSRYNLVEVDRGRIRVVEANCPNQVDVRQGWISDSTRSIVCVPNRLVIRIEEIGQASDIDGVVE